MNQPGNPLKSHLLCALVLWVAALIPRILDLNVFATVDEAKWVYRSAQFLAALLQGDLAGTVVNLTPAVTTTWLGSLGLMLLRVLQGIDTNIPLLEWLRSQPEFRVEMNVLAAVRCPAALLGSLGVVALYLLARRLINHRVALVFGALLALDPQLIALSRLLGHDAPAGIFAGLSLLAFLVAWRKGEVPYFRWMIASGALAGLAMLSKSPSFFLPPFVAATSVIRVISATGGRPSWPVVRDHLVGLFGWGVSAWLVFVALWPAAWQQPVATPYAVIHNAFLSATRARETESLELGISGSTLLPAFDDGSDGQVPELGILYYPMNGLFKLSPIATLGLVVWLVIFSKALLQRHARTSHFVAVDYVEWVLGAFVVLFTIFMTLGGKRSNRYLLPAWPALYLLAALGISHLLQTVFKLHVVRIAKYGVAGGLVLLLILPVAATAPYYLTYYNPLVGGAHAARHVVKIGWGEGLDVAGRWLQSQPDTNALRVGCAYPSALTPFFRGRVSDVTAGQLDYIVLYIKQVQEGIPSPTWLRYYQAKEPLYEVQLAGIEYARIYAGPAMQPAMANEAGLDIGILPKPIFFRLGRPYLPIGESVEVEILWLADDTLPEMPTHLTLQPATDLMAPPDARTGKIFADAEALLTRHPNGLIVSIHHLTVPTQLRRGSYGLLVDGRPLGIVEARQFRTPPLDVPMDILFGEQVRLLGIISEEHVDAEATLQLVWQAAPRAWADYTIFLQLLDANGERIAGIDAQPPVHTSAWERGEVIVMTYAPDEKLSLPIPRNLPAGDYHLIVGLYHPLTYERLTARDRSGTFYGDYVPLPVKITARPDDISERRTQRLSGEGTYVTREH